MTEKQKLKILDLALRGVSKKRIAAQCGLKRRTVADLLKATRKRMKRNRSLITALEIQPEWLEAGASKCLVHPPLVPGSQRTLLPLTRNELVLQAAFNELLDRTRKRFERWEVHLIGPGNILPDTALAISNLLKQRPPEVTLEIISHSSLINADLLVFLAGDVHTLRPDAWVVFEKPSSTPNNRHARPGASGTLCTGYQTDYREVYDGITRILPAQLADRRIHASELSEWLVDSAPEWNAATPSRTRESTEILTNP